MDLKKATFDGSSADTFAKWLQMMDDVWADVEHDDTQTMFAASQTLKGTALDFFRESRQQLATWAQLRDALINRYSYLNPSTRAKQKIRTALQHSHESV